MNEIGLQKNYLPLNFLETIYLGGGTPSLLSQNELELIFNTIFKHFSVKPNAEITLEANPDDLTDDKIQILTHSPVNRLSIGIQSFSDLHLQFMNRLHTAQEAERCVKKSQDLGFKNISIDLIYGVPSTDHAAWENDLQKATHLKTQHISAYCLTIESQTAFGNWLKKGKIKPIDEEFAAIQFEMLIKELGEAGFEHYEISNFALPDFYSRHNSNYWKQQPYLGVGPSAHSYNGKSRQWNIANNIVFAESLRKGEIPSTKEELSAVDRFNEYLLTGLRTKWGVNLENLTANTGIDFLNKNHLVFERFLQQNLLSLENNILKITDKGKLIADKITSDLFIIEEE